MTCPADSALFEVALGADDAAVEEHLFSCDSCGAQVDRFAAVGDAIAQLVRSGAIAFSATPALVDALAREGARLRTYRLASGARVACTVSAEDDFVVVRYAADLGGAEQVDLERNGHRFKDMAFRRDAGELVMAFSGDVMRTLPSGSIKLRVIAVEPGGERVLGEYALDHTAFQR